MPARDRTGRSPRRRRDLTVEGLEARNLLSFTLMTHPSHFQFNQALGANRAIQASAGTTPDLGAPTPQEAAKERFVAKLSGSFVTTPGRFQKQPVQGLILATGGSTQSLRLNLQMQFFLYNDPTITPNGQLAFSPKNVSSTGSLLVLDLEADPASLVHGLLPTHFTWTVNGGSGGAWQGATGQGTLDLKYNLNGPTRGVRSAGKVILVANGTVRTNHGLTLDIAAPGNRSKNP